MHEQLNDYLMKVGVEVKIERNTTLERVDFPSGSRHYDVIVSNQSGNSLRTVYSQGPAIKEEPSILDVMYCFVLDFDCVGLTFEDFCSDLGYDADSREDYKLWRDVRALTISMLDVLGEDVVSDIRGIVQNY